MHGSHERRGTIPSLFGAWFALAVPSARAQQTSAVGPPELEGRIVDPFGLGSGHTYLVPAFADIDGDGDLDGFAGNHQGSTEFFVNSGEAIRPAFASPVLDPFGLADVGTAAAPLFADIDGDGDLDGLVGAGGAHVFFFRNTGHASSPVFAGASSDPFGLVVPPQTFVTNPDLVDIDGDGDLDAFVGDYYGYTVFFGNTGNATSPAFGTPVSGPFGLPRLNYFAAPAFVDIDGDGDLDGFIGDYNGDTFFFQNTGTAATPAFAPFVSNPFGLSRVLLTATPAFADIDGDGDDDVFIGDSSAFDFFRQGELVFRNGFESGTLAEWSRHVP